jgi:hypothetical protein
MWIATVKHLGLGVADVFQHPPESSGDGSAKIVVTDNVVFWPHTECSQGRLEVVSRREWVAAGPSSGTEVSIEREVDSSGDVAVEIQIVSGGCVSDDGSHIQDTERVFAEFAQKIGE